MDRIYVSGAYGRRYFSPAEAQEAWKSGKNFLLYKGRYINKDAVLQGKVMFQSLTPSGEIISCVLENDE